MRIFQKVLVGPQRRQPYWKMPEESWAWAWWVKSYWCSRLCLKFQKKPSVDDKVIAGQMKKFPNPLYFILSHGVESAEKEAVACALGWPWPEPAFTLHESLLKAMTTVPLWLLTVLDGAVRIFCKPFLHWKDRKAQTGKTPTAPLWMSYVRV